MTDMGTEVSSSAGLLQSNACEIWRTRSAHANTQTLTLQPYSLLFDPNILMRLKKCLARLAWHTCELETGLEGCAGLEGDVLKHS